METDITHLVLDIGHVLIQYDPEIPFRHIIPDETERRWFLAEVCNGPWNAEQDRGRRWDEAENEKIALHPEWASQIRAFRKHWSEMVPGTVEGSGTMLEAIRDQGVDLTFLTNFAADTFVEAQERFPFLRWGRGATVSGEHGLIKPDEAIYHLHAKRFSLEPSRCMFLDDKAENVAAAQRVGWKAAQFVGAQAAMETLRAHGLLA